MAFRKSCEIGNEQFDNILNFRDVGKTVNQFLGKRYLREGVLYRSARPGERDFHHIAIQ